MAVRTVGEIKDWAATMVHENYRDSVFSSMVIPRAISQARDWVMLKEEWSFNTDRISLQWPGISGTSDASILYLPEYIDKILSMYPENLSYREPVKILMAYEFDDLRPGVGVGWAQDILVIHGLYSVEADNPSDAQLTVNSNAAGDDGETVYVEGLDANNRALRETVTLATGGPGATATTSATFKAGVGGVRRFINMSCTGTVLELLNGATVLEHLDASYEKNHRHWRTEMYAQVSGVGEYNIRYYRKHYDIPDNDLFVLEFPDEFLDIVELFVTKRIEQWREGFPPMSWAALMLEANERLKDLRAWDNRQPAHQQTVRVKKQWGGRRA